VHQCPWKIIRSSFTDADPACRKSIVCIYEGLEPIHSWIYVKMMHIFFRMESASAHAYFRVLSSAGFSLKIQMRKRIPSIPRLTGYNQYYNLLK
jgi:hypothetical protein